VRHAHKSSIEPQIPDRGHAERHIRTFEEMNVTPWTAPKVVVSCKTSVPTDRPDQIRLSGLRLSVHEGVVPASDSTDRRCSRKYRFDAAQPRGMRCSIVVENTDNTTAIPFCNPVEAGVQRMHLAGKR